MSDLTLPSDAAIKNASTATATSDQTECHAALRKDLAADDNTAMTASDVKPPMPATPGGHDAGNGNNNGAANVSPFVQFARLTAYVSSAMSHYIAVHTAQPELGLKLQLGPREACRLLAAVERHGRAEQFANLRIPFDVLLRVLALLPTAFNKRAAKQVAQSAALHSPMAQLGGGFLRRTGESLPPPSSSLATLARSAVAGREEMASKAQLRAAATCSMLLMAVMENGHVLGATQDCVPVQRHVL
jgi:hypothetical protein